MPWWHKLYWAAFAVCVALIASNKMRERLEDANETEHAKRELKRNRERWRGSRTVVRGNARVRSEDGENDDDNYFDGDRTKKEEGGGEEEEEEEEEEDR